MQRRSIEPPQDLRRAFNNYLRRGADLQDPDRRILEDAQKAVRALNTQLGTAGGFTIPGEFSGMLEVALKRTGSVLEAGTIIWTERGSWMGYPQVDDTANSANITEDNGDVGSATDPAFSFRGFTSFDYPSGVVLMPWSLLEDNGVQLDEKLFDLLGLRCKRGLNPHLTTGTGNMQPTGILTAATVTVTTANPLAFTYSEIQDLIFSVDAEYRANGSFMCHDTVLKYAAKMVDGNGRPLYQVKREQRTPDGKIVGELCGYPVSSNSDMPAIASGAPAAGQKLLLFGDLSKYHVRIVKNPILGRLTEQYGDKRQTGFVTMLRADGNLLDAGTHPVAAMQQHA
jgi:HK97 family phage major capsid protein